MDIHRKHVHVPKAKQRHSTCCLFAYTSKSLQLLGHYFPAVVLSRLYGKTSKIPLISP